MRQVITALLAMTCFALFAAGRVEAQVPKAVSIGFTNKSPVHVVVSGYTIVNGMRRVGQAVPLRRGGGSGFEANVPPGVRVYTILDAATFTPIGQMQVLIPNRDFAFDIVPMPGNPKRLILIPAQ